MCGGGERVCVCVCVEVLCITGADPGKTKGGAS